MESKEEKTPQEIEIQCKKELVELLTKHNCVLEVDFEKQHALGNAILVYRPVIVYKGEKTQSKIN